jgi:hypothetical protein
MKGDDLLAHDDWSEWVEPMRRARMQCEYYGLDGTRDLASFRQMALHMDHLLPRSLGGGHTLENLVITCWPCNLNKGAFDPRNKNADGTRDPNTPRPRMIENVREYLQGAWDYNEKAWRAFIGRLSGNS